MFHKFESNLQEKDTKLPIRLEFGILSFESNNRILISVTNRPLKCPHHKWSKSAKKK